MQEGHLSLQDGMIMRSLVNFPGGLELHIGVRSKLWVYVRMAGRARRHRCALHVVYLRMSAADPARRTAPRYAPGG